MLPSMPEVAGSSTWLVGDTSAVPRGWAQHARAADTDSLAMSHYATLALCAILDVRMVLGVEAFTAG